MIKLGYEEMFEAMASNDSGYDGRFYVGVHSTGIYCLPSCKAKLPRPENIVFYDSREEAIAAGLRGCKRCRSETFPDVFPSWLHDVLKYMQENFNTKINEDRLIKMAGVNITTVRRYFKNHLGTTPLAFHRRQRLFYARGLLESGTDYLNAAYECGYSSVSGFREAFTRQFGKPPGSYYAR